jgi:hypothetical protein
MSTDTDHLPPHQTAESPPRSDNLTASPDALQKPHKKRGRPTVFDQQKRQAFCIMIQMGCSVRAAAAHIGIDKKSVEYARRHDPEFDAEVRTAEHSRNMNLLSNIVSAGNRSWRASAWLLSAVQPELYGALRRRGAATPVARDKERLKDFVTNIVNEIILDCINVHEERHPDMYPPADELARPPARQPGREPARQPERPLQYPADLAVAAIDDRLAQIDARLQGPPRQYPELEEFLEDPRNRKVMADSVARLKNRLLKKHGSKLNSNRTNQKQQPPSA